MPELPEVETIVRQLGPLIVGRRIRAFEVYDSLLGVERPERIAGRRIAAVRRLGKQILIGLSPARGGGPACWIAIHLRMTGRLLWKEAAGPKPSAPAPIRARWLLDRGVVLFHDTRRFGTIRWHDRPESAAPEGLDPTTAAFTAGALAALLTDSRQPVKPWLLRQDRLTGIGNIYASEALFAARIHPAREAGSLTREETRRLCRALREVLHRAIAAGGTSFSDFQNVRGDIGGYQKNLRVYDHAGEPCPRCGRPIVRIVQQQRATFHCPGCQPPGGRKRAALPARPVGAS